MLTLPVWVFSLMVGTPCLVVLVLGLLRRRRRDEGLRPPERPGAQISPRSPSGQRSEDLGRFIDASFQALAATLEAERLRLKTLSLNATPPTGGGAMPLNLSEATGQADDPAEVNTDVGRTAAAMAGDGLPPERIARMLGLSHQEVALALKFNPPPADHRRCEAVA